jgi:hypothetical protein
MAYPSYLEFMLHIPVAAKADRINLYILYFDNPHTGISTGYSKENLTVEEYQKAIREAADDFDTKMPKNLKKQILRDQTHLL